MGTDRVDARCEAMPNSGVLLFYETSRGGVLQMRKASLRDRPPPAPPARAAAPSALIRLPSDSGRLCKRLLPVASGSQIHADCQRSRPSALGHLTGPRDSGERRCGRGVRPTRAWVAPPTALSPSGRTLRPHKSRRRFPPQTTGLRSNLIPGSWAPKKSAHRHCRPCWLSISQPGGRTQNRTSLHEFGDI